MYGLLIFECIGVFMLVRFCIFVVSVDKVFVIVVVLIYIWVYIGSDVVFVFVVYVVVVFCIFWCCCYIGVVSIC